jgi:hypothetical protein
VKRRRRRHEAPLSLATGEAGCLSYKPPWGAMGEARCSVQLGTLPNPWGERKQSTLWLLEKSPVGHRGGSRGLIKIIRVDRETRKKVANGTGWVVNRYEALLYITHRKYPCPLD